MNSEQERVKVVDRALYGEAEPWKKSMTKATMAREYRLLQRENARLKAENQTYTNALHKMKNEYMELAAKFMHEATK